jgi:CUB/sushi domain-containing protein
MLSSNQSTFLTGRVLHFSCEPGFLLEGPTSIYCKTNDTWSEKRIPRCSGCPHPGHLGNGYFINSKGVTYIEGVKAVDEIITIHCNRNFTLQGGRRSRTCLKDGGWSNGGQACVAASCKPPENFTSNGLYTFPDGANVTSRNIQIGDKLILTCEQGFSSMENDYAVCQKGGKWSYGTGHGCRIVNSTNQVKIENGNYVFTKKVVSLY